jgi:hypothetical protein
MASARQARLQLLLHRRHQHVVYFYSETTRKKLDVQISTAVLVGSRQLNEIRPEGHIDDSARIRVLAKLCRYNRSISIGTSSDQL